MREILFRGKGNDNREWVYWNIFGELCRESGKRTRLAVRKGATISYYDYIHQIFTLIDKNTICQFTGLLDKNGNKIWENDIFRVNTKDNYTGKVMFENGVFKVEWLTDDLLRTDLFFWTSKRAIEVIGNVFDNKELLEE